MIILDENFPESQRQLLRGWRVPIRQIGYEVGRSGFARVRLSLLPGNSVDNVRTICVIEGEAMAHAHKIAAPAFERKICFMRFMQMLALCFLVIGLPANAAERSEADFVKACLSSSNLSKEICECSAKKAKGEFSPDGFALLVAMLEKNNEVSASLRSKLPFDQTMKVGTFMARAPAQCAKESAPK